MRRRVTAAAALALFAAPSPARAQRAWETPGQADAVRGQELADNGRCAEALDAFDRAILHRTRDAALRRDRGRCHAELGHRLPAIEDYRAYLSMAPDAPDAGAVRERLVALEAEEEAAANSQPDPEASAIRAPEEKGEAEEEDEHRARRPHGLFGAHVGARDWSAQGFPGATWSIGVEGGLAYHPNLEIDLRLALLTTGKSSASGGGISLAHAFRFPFGWKDQYEAVLALGGGYEQQQNELKVTRRYWFGRLTPSFRWAFHEAVLVQAGPELGLGAIPHPSELAEPGNTKTAAYWGGRAEVLWIIR